jgi:cytoskeletal protein CcmA (bactofilin family)
MAKAIRFIVIGLMALGPALATAGTALALESREGGTITIGPNEIVDDDVLLAGETVIVDGTINGNLFAGGTTITINGTVNGSVFVAGQALIVNGKITGSLFGGGASLTLGRAAAIDRNLLFGGYTLTTADKSVIKRDLLMGGLVATLNGAVGRDVRMGGEALEINGTVGRDVFAEVGDAAAGTTYFGPVPFAPGLPTSIDPGLRVGPEAKIAGALTYTARAAQASGIQAQPAGGVVFQTPVPGRDVQPVTPVFTPEQTYGFTVMQWFLDRGRDFITLLLLGALMLWAWPNVLTATAEATRTHPLAATGWGLLIVIAGYVAAFVTGVFIVALGITFMIATLGGLSGAIFGVGFSSLGLAVSLFTLLVSYGSKLIVSYLVGWLIVRAFSSTSQWLALLVGVTLYVLASGLPLVGWLVSLVVTLIGVGAAWLVFRQWQMSRTPAARPAPPRPVAMPA